MCHIRYNLKMKFKDPPADLYACFVWVLIIFSIMAKLSFFHYTFKFGLQP